VNLVTDVLTVRSLSKSYSRRPVLDGIDLTIPAGTVTAVTGANGSGKSTLFRCIAGLASYTGEVSYRGVPITDMAAHLGYLPQSVGLASWATVGETITFFARLRGADPADIPFPEGFVPDPDRQVGILSGGQRQRVALAIALLGDPSLLLLDEPSANLDDDSRSALWNVLADSAARGAIVLVATPTDADLGTLDRSVVRIVDGRLVSADGRARGSNGVTQLVAVSEVGR
jgi:ABC-2 type transport system ATP-binding protein